MSEHNHVSVQENSSRIETGSEGGMSMAAPAFSLSASPAQLQADPNAPIQQVVELTEAQIEAAISHNNFILGDAAARNEVLNQMGVTEAAGTFDQAAVQTIANYQETNAIARQDGRVDRETLDFVLRAMVDAGDHAGVITVITDFFNLNELQNPVQIQYDPGVTGDAVPSTAETGETIYAIGDDSFANGLDGLGHALNTAIGAGTSLNAEALDVMLADTGTAREEAMWDNPGEDNESGLVPWIRDNFPTQEDLAAFLARTDLTDEEKTAAFGRISVELGRLEFLMGVIFHGGNNQNWETGGSNQGPFVDHFKEAVGNNPNTQPWCTMFSGYLKTLLGFEDDLADGGPLIFNSGARLDWWGTAGTNLITGTDNFSDPSDFENYSGADIDTADWSTLRQSVTGSLTDEEKATAVDTWLETRTTPQPGDILIIRTSSTNNSYGSGMSSHTTTIESYNDYTISTIEGNRGGKVTGVELDLRDSGDVGEIICLVRAGIEFFTENQAATPTAEGETATTEGGVPAAEAADTAQDTATNVVEEEDIMNPLRQMVRNLQLIAGHKGYVADSTAGATVADMAGNTAGTGTQ